MADDEEAVELGQSEAGEDETPQPQQYVNWALSVQCQADQAGDALEESFNAAYSDGDDLTREAYTAVKAMVTDFCDSQGSDWFQINISGAPARDTVRPSVHMAITPVAAPYGV